MRMKKLFFMLFAFLICGITHAQEIELTLNDGKVVNGTTKSSFMFDGFHEISVKDAKSGEKTDYNSTDVKSVKLYDSKTKEWNTFVPLMAQKSMPSIWNKNPKPYKNPIFMMPLYEGKHVSAYKHFISTQTNTKNAQIHGKGWILYFKVKDEDIAKAFCMNAFVGVKALLKIVFKDYPEMKETVKTLDTDEFCKDPVELIRKFDDILK